MYSRKTLGLQMAPAEPASATTPARTQLFRAALFVFVISPIADVALWFIDRVVTHQDNYYPTAVFMRRWLQFFASPSLAGNDSWMPMRGALAWFEQHPGGRMFEQLFFVEHVKFQYPPSSLLPLHALHSLGIDPTDALLNGIGWFVMLINVIASGAFAFVLASRSANHAAFRWHWGIFGALAALSFFPILMAFRLGQAQVWINTLFALAALSYVLRRNALTGVLIGLICLCKPQLALFILWGLLRRQWRFCAGMLVTIAVGGVLSLAVFGLQNHIDYLHVLRELSRTGEAYMPNQSVNGFLNRLFHTVADPSVWQARGFPAFHPIVYGGTLLSSAVLIGFALLLPLRADSKSGLLDFLIAGLTFAVASPIAWEHHYGIMPAMYLAVMFAFLSFGPSNGKSIALAALAASYFVTDHWLGGSWMLCGVLAVLGLMYWAGPLHAKRLQG
ncbi:hypothetical protein AWB74_03717 [Caballeronia arvi]|uniref:Polyprenol-phosphate-mannose-dependent alpha-(1-2)-phosphatidylinositol mannoside mannosyltransferase n=1 Tax=Caballeronia arvi TaxID=1777135 RepID=A0A158JC55_9BURK|nr:glycosyltransferase family 87 protein [Caballeronia arvi]SAL66387.1 hypothetical protein AWB74_03717 [Caballeronia arvi]